MKRLFAYVARSWKGSSLRLKDNASRRSVSQVGEKCRPPRTRMTVSFAQPASKSTGTVRDWQSISSSYRPKTIVVGRYVKAPDDVLVFGCAHGMQHVDGRDRASPADLEERPWKVDWPIYIRVVNPEFIDGEFSHGVSLNQLMKELWSETFASSSRRAAETGRNDIDPRDSLPRQTQLELTPLAIQRLSDRLEQCFKAHGKISKDELAKLDWPNNLK